MALDLANLKVIGTDGVNTLWLYKSTDAIATIAGSGYFNNAYAGLRQNDVVVAVSSTGGTRKVDALIVTSEDHAATVTTQRGAMPNAGYYVALAGTKSTAGGAAAEDLAITGLLETDIVLATIQDNGTNNVTLLQTVPKAGGGALTCTFSADPGNDAVIQYVVLRAV